MKQIFLAAILFLLFSCQSISDLGILVPMTVDEDNSLPSKSITVANHIRKVHVSTYGNPQNPVLFILHGSYTDIRPYSNICELLSDKYYVVIWDQRGCGLSERITEDEFTLQSAVDEINAIKNIYSPNEKINILGQSWGGGLATLYTATNSEKVNQLILIEPMPLTGSDMQQLFTQIVNFNYFNETWNNMARHSKTLSPTDHEQLDYQAQMILRSTMTSGYYCDSKNPPPWPIHRVGGYIEYVRNKRLGDPVSGYTYDFTKGLENYSNEVLILGGSCSSLGYDMQNTYSKPHFNAVRIVEIMNAGHRMTMEKPDAVMQVCKSFLEAYK